MIIASHDGIWARRLRIVLLVALLAASGVSLFMFPVPVIAVLIFAGLGAGAGLLLSTGAIVGTLIVLGLYLVGMEAAIQRWFPPSVVDWWQPDLITLTAAVAVREVARPVIARLMG